MVRAWRTPFTVVVSLAPREPKVTVRLPWIPLVIRPLICRVTRRLTCVWARRPLILTVVTRRNLAVVLKLLLMVCKLRCLRVLSARGYLMPNGRRVG